MLNYETGLEYKKFNHLAYFHKQMNKL